MELNLPFFLPTPPSTPLLGPFSALPALTTFPAPAVMQPSAAAAATVPPPPPFSSAAATHPHLSTVLCASCFIHGDMDDELGGWEVHNEGTHDVTVKCRVHGWGVPVVLRWICGGCSGRNEAWEERCEGCGEWYGEEEKIIGWEGFLEEVEVAWVGIKV